MISTVRSDSDDARHEAVSELCDIYWYPVYSYFRKRGCSEDDAKDLTQQLFERFLEKDGFAAVDQDKGRLRSYLLTCATHLINENWRKQSRDKRGGGRTHISIDQAIAEARYRNEPRTDESPEKLFDRHWALALLKHVEIRLEEEYAKRQPVRFRALKPFIPGDTWEVGFDRLAEKTGETAQVLRTQLSRYRKAYKRLLREELANTLHEGADIDGEMESLRAALRR